MDDRKPLHISEGDSPMLDGYVYSSTGVGVRADLIDEVLKVWAYMSPYGDPARTLRSCGDGEMNAVDNIARVAVKAVLEALEPDDGE